MAATPAVMTAEEALSMSYEKEIVVEQVISAPIASTFDKFREYVCLKNGGLSPESWTKIIAEGQESSHEGETSTVAAGVVKEQILCTIPNEEIMYKLIGSPMPISNHLVIVKFASEGENKTKITWTCKFTPVTGTGMMLSAMMRAMFAQYLSNLESALVKESPLPEHATADEAAHAESQNYTDSTTVEKIISAPVPVAFQKFREVVWLRNGGVGPSSWTRIVEEGEGKNHVGEVRKAAGIMQEKILRIVENELILYTVIKGPFPVHNHLGRVTFTPEGTEKTKITWSVSYTPMMGANLMVKGICQAFFPIFLNTLESSVKQS